MLDPAPLRLHVLDVAPPWPAKLVDQIERVLQTAEDLPGVAALPSVVELSSLLPDAPSGHYLLQCRGGGMEVPGRVGVLSRRGPAPQGLDLARLREVPRDPRLPLRRPGPADRHLPPHPRPGRHVAPGEVLLIKCCLLEEHIESEGQTVVVPWGATFSQLREGLAAAVELAGTAPLSAPAEEHS